METGTDTTKTTHFELDITGSEEGGRCYLCHTGFGQMFELRPPDSPRGRLALHSPCRRRGRRVGPGGIEVWK